MVQYVFSFVIVLLQDEFDTYRAIFYPISISGWSFLFLIKTKSLSYAFWIDPISIWYVEKIWYGFRNPAEIFTTILNGWKPLPIVIKNSTLYIGRVSGSTASREWNEVVDLKLKFTMFSIAYLRREGQHQILEKVSSD